MAASISTSLLKIVSKRWTGAIVVVGGGCGGRETFLGTAQQNEVSD